MLLYRRTISLTKVPLLAAALLLLTFAGPAAEAQVVHPFEDDEAVAPITTIDVRVLATLRRHGIEPAKPCSDEVFIRRVHLDVIGTLPDPREVRRFLRSRHPEKRAVLIDGKYVSFYRFHVRDPVYFSQDIKVTIQQIGNDGQHEPADPEGKLAEFIKRGEYRKERNGGNFERVAMPHARPLNTDLAIDECERLAAIAEAMSETPAAETEAARVAAKLSN